MNTAIKPCPFCGSKDISYYAHAKRDEDSPDIFCMCCNGSVNGVNGINSFNIWNNRPSEDALENKLDDLKKKHKELTKNLHELGKQIAEFNADTKDYQQITLMIPKDSGLFTDFRVNDMTYEHDFYKVSFKLYEPSANTYTFDDAIDIAANNYPRRLLTREEIHLLIETGYLKKGDTTFWSSSVVSSGRTYAWAFYGFDGNVSVGVQSGARAVRCVGR